MVRYIPHIDSKIWIFFFFSIFYNQSGPLYPQIITHTEHYERGIAQRDSGNWQAALDIWLTERDSLNKKKGSDLRIGISFIELTTEKKANDYYEQASAIYLLGFSHPIAKKHQQELENEIARLVPLLDQKELSEWQNLLKKDNAKLVQKIKNFWESKDPIPTTKTNERLIEHWLRIAHIKENFKMDKSTAYGTDERGLVYVKYGEPDRKFAGKLGEHQSEIMRWFDDFLLRQEIQRYNNTPEVEIWVYENLRKDSPTVFLFGKKSGFGKYGLRAGVEDFIPDRAFRRSSARTTVDVVPGTVIQLMYYSELFHVDRYFLSRFRKLEALWGNARTAGQLSPNRDVLLGLRTQYKSLDKDKFRYLPLDKTNIQNELKTGVK